MRSATLTVLVLLAISACGGPPDDATGEEIYVQVCARCHAADLSGGVGPALGPGSAAADHPRQFLVETVTGGRGRMPSFGETLSAAQIQRVVDFLRRRQGEP